MTAGVMASTTVLAILFSILMLGASEKKLKDLQIISEFKPDDCFEFADDGDEVLVHYTGMLENGQVFDSSVENNRPLPFVMGQGKVISGWELGIKGMCPGEKRKLIIPPHLGYGSNGFPPVIPADATLTFETELLAIQKASVTDDIVPLLRFLAVPAGIAVVAYYIYQKYQQTEPGKSKRELKEEKRSKRKRK